MNLSLSSGSLTSVLMHSTLNSFPINYLLFSPRELWGGRAVWNVSEMKHYLGNDRSKDESHIKLKMYMPGFQGEKFPDFSTEVIYESSNRCTWSSYLVLHLSACTTFQSQQTYCQKFNSSSCSDVKFFKNLDDYNIIIFKIGNKTNNLAIRILQKLSRA